MFFFSLKITDLHWTFLVTFKNHIKFLFLFSSKIRETHPHDVKNKTYLRRLGGIAMTTHSSVAKRQALLSHTFLSLSSRMWYIFWKYFSLRLFVVALLTAAVAAIWVVLSGIFSCVKEKRKRKYQRKISWWEVSFSFSNSSRHISPNERRMDEEKNLFIWLLKENRWTTHAF